MLLPKIAALVSTPHDPPRSSGRDDHNVAFWVPGNGILVVVLAQSVRQRCRRRRLALLLIGDGDGHAHASRVRLLLRLCEAVDPERERRGGGIRWGSGRGGGSGGGGGGGEAAAGRWKAVAVAVVVVVDDDSPRFPTATATKGQPTCHAEPVAPIGRVQLLLLLLKSVKLGIVHAERGVASMLLLVLLLLLAVLGRRRRDERRCRGFIARRRNPHVRRGLRAVDLVMGDDDAVGVPGRFRPLPHPRHRPGPS